MLSEAWDAIQGPAGGCALLAGLYGALLLLGTSLPAPPVPLEAVHGPLMVLGFAGR
ncbi:hypothetical protein [Dactylosporangium sp. NPDC005555]|uniref:hypothetical protein n=1 Tax=Dactylosporangium sp. NPDC005555 TaxID=3154889 RepID=UPI0033A0A84F